VRYKGVSHAIIGGIAMTRGSSLPFALAALVTLPALAQDGDEAAFERIPQDCVSVSLIDETDAVDDQNILFHMRNGDVYRNHLPRKCPGLERENRIAYKLEGSRRLCSINTITVLEEGIGGFGGNGLGFREGFTCRLGEFVPLSPEEIEELELLVDGKTGRRTQSTIETTSVEPPAAEPSDDAEPAAGDAQD
jgi:hypothetical protein